MHAPLAALLVLVALVAGLGCGGDDDDGSAEGEDYAADVEAISDDAYDASQDALVTLNEVADGSLPPGSARAVLDRSARRVEAQTRRLAALTPPELAAGVADDLSYQLDSLARVLDSVAVDLTLPGADAADAGRNGARIVLAIQSGISALSRALGTLAAEAD